MHLSHFAAHNLFISLAASTAALPAVSFSQLLSFPDIPTSPPSPHSHSLLAKMHGDASDAGDADADPAQSFV